MMIRVSTPFCSPDARLRDAHAALAFKVERLGDDPDREDAEIAGGLGDNRRCAGAGAAAHAGGDKHHVGAGQVIADFVDDFLGGGAPTSAPRTGAEAFGGGHAHLMMRSAFDNVSAWASVWRRRNRRPEPRGDHVVDGVAAGTADSEHGDPRLQLPDVGNF
jgi:hypothetical protein